MKRVGRKYKKRWWEVPLSSSRHITSRVLTARIGARPPKPPIIAMEDPIILAVSRGSFTALNPGLQKNLPTTSLQVTL